MQIWKSSYLFMFLWKQYYKAEFDPIKYINIQNIY